MKNKTKTFAEKIATNDQLGAEIAGPVPSVLGAAVNSIFSVRTAIDDTPAGGWSPAKLAKVVTEARTLINPAAYYSLAEEIEEKDANFRSVIGTRKIAVAALPFKVEPASDSARDKEVADFVKKQLDSATVRQSLKGMLDAISKGVSVNEIVWQPGADAWKIASIEHRDPRHFTFDKTDGRTVLMLPETAGGALVPLPDYKFIIHTPQLKAGLPVRSGLAMPAAWAYVLKWAAKKNWNAFAELSLKPFRLGKFKPGTSKEDIAVLRKAVAQLGADAAALLPENMSIEFIKDASVSASAEVYERLIRYLDEQVAKLVLGASLTTGTSNTGSGGSQALGVVHAELRADLMKDDAASLSATLMRDLVRPLVEINFGAGTPLPTASLVVEEPEDLIGLAEIVEKLVGAGVPLSKKGIAARFNLPLAETEDDAATTAQPAASGAFAAWSKCPEHGTSTFATQRDALDDLADEMLADWQEVGSGLDAQLSALAAQSTGIDDLRAKLAAFAQSAEPSALMGLLAKARSKAGAAGRFGADL